MLITLPDHRAIPRLDEPAKVVGLTLLVSIQCACGADTPIGLVNAQAAVCESCGAVFSLDAVSWSSDGALPKIAIRSLPSRAQMLTS